jgi:hypothetical protein
MGELPDILLNSIRMFPADDADSWTQITAELSAVCSLRVPWRQRSRRPDYLLYENVIHKLAWIPALRNTGREKASRLRGKDQFVLSRLPINLFLPPAVFLVVSSPM